MGFLPLVFKKFNWNLIKKLASTNELPLVKPNYNNLSSSNNDDYLFPPTGYVAKMKLNNLFKRDAFIGIKLFSGNSITN